jgi:chlorophyll synthase
MQAMSGLEIPIGERPVPRLPRAGAVLELLKPLTWFPPMWAFMCGVVSSGAPIADRWGVALAGIVLAGPAVCATSQAVNDWFDRDVDAINEPQRPIPSGRIPGRWGLWIALCWTVVSLGLAAALGRWVFGAAMIGMALAWAYSAPPFRLKESGWLGAAACALCYEGLAWFTGAAVMGDAFPSQKTTTMAVLYSAGAIGIMILNDFKAIEGDAQMGVQSVPVTLGAPRAAQAACAIMAAPQVVVIGLLAAWGAPLHAAVIGVGLVAQLALMPRFLRDPKRLAPWYQGTGTTLSVLGMLVAALAIGGH